MRPLSSPRPLRPQSPAARPGSPFATTAPPGEHPSPPLLSAPLRLLSGFGKAVPPLPAPPRTVLGGGGQCLLGTPLPSPGARGPLRTSPLGTPSKPLPLGTPSPPAPGLELLGRLSGRCRPEGRHRHSPCPPTPPLWVPEAPGQSGSWGPLGAFAQPAPSVQLGTPRARLDALEPRRPPHPDSRRHFPPEPVRPGGPRPPNAHLLGSQCTQPLPPSHSPPRPPRLCLSPARGTRRQPLFSRDTHSPGSRPPSTTACSSPGHPNSDLGRGALPLLLVHSPSPNHHT